VLIDLPRAYSLRLALTTTAASQRWDLARAGAEAVRSLQTIVKGVLQ